MKRLFGPLALSGIVTACLTGPQAVDARPGEYLRGQQPTYVWLTLNDGTDLVVAGPRVISDTVFGWDETGTENITIAVADIKEVRARKVSTVRTAMIPAAVLAGTGLALIMITASGEEAALSAADSADMEIEP
jgi:hypothetical protein